MAKVKQSGAFECLKILVMGIFEHPEYLSLDSYAIYCVTRKQTLLLPSSVCCRSQRRTDFTVVFVKFHIVFFCPSQGHIISYDVYIYT